MKEISSLDIANIFRLGSLINYKSENYFVGITKDKLNEYKKKFIESKDKDFVSYLLKQRLVVIKLNNIELIGKLK